MQNKQGRDQVSLIGTTASRTAYNAIIQLRKSTEKLPDADILRTMLAWTPGGSAINNSDKTKKVDAFIVEDSCIGNRKDIVNLFCNNPDCIVKLCVDM
jgi:hypothetical protein